MNEELQTALQMLVEKSLDGIDAATGILTAEIPDVIQQLLLWYGVKSGLAVLFSVLVLACYPKLFKWSKKIATKPCEGESNWFWSWKSYCNKHEMDGGGAFFTGIGIVSVAFITFAVVLNIFDLEWLQILIAPKVWLIEYVSSLA